MKKIAIVGIFVAAIIAVVIFITQSDETQSGAQQDTPQQNETLKAQGSTLTSNESLSSDDIQEAEQELVETENTVDAETQSHCEQMANSPDITKYRELSLETYNEVYAQVGDSTYEKLPLESVRSYADNGEASAMWHYGVEVMWKEALGSYRNPVNQEKPLTQEELWEVLKKHDPNFEMFNHGKEYAFRAAIQGRVGAILETANMETFLARQIKIREGRDKDAIDTLASAVAHIRLMEYIHRNDPSVIANMRFEERIKNKISTVYNYEEFMQSEERSEQLNTKVKQLLSELEKQWKEKRLEHNKPLHPDLFEDELEAAFMDYADECL